MNQEGKGRFLPQTGEPEDNWATSTQSQCRVLQSGPWPCCPPPASTSFPMKIPSGSHPVYCCIITTFSEQQVDFLCLPVFLLFWVLLVDCSGSFLLLVTIWKEAGCEKVDPESNHKIFWMELAMMEWRSILTMWLLHYSSATKTLQYVW